MRQFMIALAGGALAVLVAGCASLSAEVGSASRPPVSPSNTVRELRETWRGSYYQTAHIGDSRLLHGDFALKIDDHGMYTGTRTIRHVAGSMRGGQSKISGTVVATGTRVMFNDQSGWRMTLTRKGNTLYGVTADPGAQ